MSLINLYGLYTSLLQSWIELILHKCMGHMFDWGSFLPNHQPSPQSNSELASTRSWEWSGPSPQIDSAWKQPQTNELYIYRWAVLFQLAAYIYMHMYTYIHNVYIVIYIYIYAFGQSKLGEPLTGTVSLRAWPLGTRGTAVGRRAGPTDWDP